MHLSFSSVLKKHLYCLSAMRSTTVTLMVLHSEWHCRLQALPEPQISLTAETNQPLKQKSSLCLWKSKYSLKLVSQITSPWIQSYNSPMLSNFSFLVYLEGIGHLHLSYFPPCFAGTLFFLLFFNFYLFFLIFIFLLFPFTIPRCRYLHISWEFWYLPAKLKIAENSQEVISWVP